MRKIVSVAVALFATAAAAAPPAPQIVKRVIVAYGRQSGTCVTTTAADGSVDIVLDELENGRGPHVDAKLRLAADGTLASFSASGHHEMGTKLAEELTRQGAHARWQSEEEHGERDVAGSAFFVPLTDVPGIEAILIQALLKAGRPLPLLPAGEARLEKVGEIDVAASGQTRHLIGYAVTGVDLLPAVQWMNGDGSWFGTGSPGYSVVPDGWQSAIVPLIVAKRAFMRARDAKLAAAQAHRPPAAGLAYTHARVLDVERGAWVAEQTVVVAGDTIRAMGPTAGTAVPAGAETIDLAGKALLPGLWDMHAHLGDSAGVLDIASGVTTVRDVGNDPDRLDDFKQRFDDGKAIGPTVFRFGLIEGRNPKAAASTITAETADEAKAAVAEFARRGYDGIKIYNSVRPELVPLLAREAHARGMAVTGHVPVHMLANEVVRAGYDGIEHITMLFLNFFATHETETRDITRFTLVGDKAAAFDLQGRPMRDFVKLLRDRHTVVDPTIGAFEDLFAGEPGKIIPGLEETTARLPVQLERTYLQNGLPDRSKAKLYRESFDKLLAMVKLLVDEKITVVIGTDTLPGLFLHHELALFVRAGVSPADALRMATIVPARVLGRQRQSGSIAVGKTADLVVVDGDPLARIADIGRVVATVRRGVVFASRPLYESVGVRALR